MTLVPPAPGDPGERAPIADWRSAGVPLHDGGAIVHVCPAHEDVPRVAPLIRAIDATGAFDQVVLDAGGRRGSARALLALGVDVALRRVGGSRAELARALRDELALLPAVAVLVYDDDDAGVAAALAAARLGVSLVRVGAVPTGAAATPSRRLVARLADLLLVHGEEDAQALCPAIAPERIHVIGNPLIDAVRRAKSPAPPARTPGGYVLAVLAAADAALVAALAALAARVELLIDAPAHVRVPGARRLDGRADFHERLALQRAAGAIVTDSRRAQEEAAALGVRCYALGPRYERVAVDAGGTTVALEHAGALAAVRLEPHAPTPCAIPLWDGRAGARAADVLVTNFARLRPI